MLRSMCCIFLLAVQSGCVRVNLALNKSSFMSSQFGNHFAKYATDGDVKTFAEAADLHDNGWLLVDLERPFQVEEVIFHHSLLCEPCDRMDNFVVGLFNVGYRIGSVINRTYELCEEHSGTIAAGEKVSLHCRRKELYFRYVIIQQERGQSKLIVAEVEAMGEYVNYVGCFETLEDVRSLGPGYDHKRCLDECHGSTHKYAAMRVSECLCGSEVRSHRKLSDCSLKCTGNIDYCGAPDKLSVYEAHTANEDPRLFRNPPNCESGMALNLQGFCEKCKPGWTGPDCTSRDCSVNRGDCGYHSCMVLSTSFGKLSECICKSNFDKMFWWDYCYDIDECKEKSTRCDGNTTNCINRDGGYSCTCISGFVPVNSSACTKMSFVRRFTASAAVAGIPFVILAVTTLTLFKQMEVMDDTAS